MRISGIAGIAGELPVMAAPNEPPPSAAPAGGPPPPAVAAAAATSGGSGAGTGTHDRHRAAPVPLPVFDPPLIAQRAALGLPVGALICELADREDITYSAASAAVDRSMPHEPTDGAAGIQPAADRS